MFKILWKFLKINSEINKQNILIGAFLSIWAHPLYWSIWTYIYPHYYDSAILRFSISIFSIILILHNYWPKSLQKLLPLYWYLFVMYDLTIIFTFLGFKNGFTGVWIVCEIMAIFFTMVLTYHWILIIINLICGFSIGGLLYFLTTDNPTFINQDYIEYFLPALFTVVAGLILTHFGRIGVTGIARKEKDIQFEKDKV